MKYPACGALVRTNADQERFAIEFIEFAKLGGCWRHYVMQYPSSTGPSRGASGSSNDIIFRASVNATFRIVDFIKADHIVEYHILILVRA